MRWEQEEGQWVVAVLAAIYKSLNAKGGLRAALFLRPYRTTGDLSVEGKNAKNHLICAT
jgi:hypothetical protein